MMRVLTKNQRAVTLLYILILYLYLYFTMFPLQIKLVETGINLLIVLPLLGALLALFRINCLAFATHSVILYAVYYVDRILYANRLIHLRYSDLFAVQDGLRVAEKYRFPFEQQDWIVLMVFVLINLILILVSHVEPEKQDKKENALIGLTLCIGTLIVLAGGVAFQWIPDPTKQYEDVFDSNGAVERYGLYYNLYNQYRNSRLKAPEGYSSQKATELLSRYDETEEQYDGEPIHLIVIMNESLSDYSLIGQTSFSDPLVNIHNTDNNYRNGKLAVSVYGGYTCNTEFEFLTGCSLAFFPQDYLPYSQMIVSDLDSLAWEMRALGMDADAVHPYYSQEWNRRSVYRYLGFQSFTAGEDFSTGMNRNDEVENITDIQLGGLDFGDDVEYIRGFISDAECYRKVLSLLEEQKGKSSFTFAVTVQNHGGYTYEGEDFENKQYISGDEEVQPLNQYLTCSAISDAAFQELIDQLRDTEEKTVVLMFGDHQPALEFNEYVAGFDDTPENKYYVPYVFWSNFDNQMDLPEVVSVNYLSALLKQYAGIPLTAWDRFRLSVMEEYPVLSAQAVLGRSLEAVDLNDAELLQKYECIQYMRVKDGG